MRTNIEIDDELMAQVLQETGLSTKRAAVDEALKLLLQMRRQRRVLGLAGKVRWEGNLDESRLGRFVDE